MTRFAPPIVKPFDPTEPARTYIQAWPVVADRIVELETALRDLIQASESMLEDSDHSPGFRTLRNTVQRVARIV
jgi:hypothetical protein